MEAVALLWVFVAILFAAGLALVIGLAATHEPVRPVSLTDYLFPNDPRRD